MTKRVLISLSDELLERIDDACRRLGMTRSGYLAQLADATLLGTTGPGADPTVRAALAEIDALFTTP
ncbi:MAG TPA: type II toxin-antitoxin system HicB family antitoxin [Candidatus Limnocylindria bacterium]|nr:type II toxin-antitoxin system HicB family antitoxin [Candidatus Limnocylindria bacterium]